MPRVSRAQARSHREAITDASARLFKEHGIKSVSVADLMGAAGLTHGGFYGHFESKDALAGIAVEHAFAQSVERWRQRVETPAAPTVHRAALVEAYLSAQSVRNAATGCPTVALAGDVAREPAQAPIRAAYAEGVEGLLRILASVEQAGSAEADRRAALVDYATMVGAALLARATAGTPLSAQVLAAARERLLPGSGPHTTTTATTPPTTRATPRRKPRQES